MPLDGSGHFTPIEPQFPAVPNTVILSQDYNDIWNDAAEVLSLAMYRDGQAEVIADIPFWEHKITRLAKGTADTDATNFDQVFHNPHFQSTVAGDPDGVVVEGNRFTVRSSESRFNSSNTQFTGAYFKVDNSYFDLKSATVDIDSNIATLDTITSIALRAGTTLSLTGVTSAAVNAPTISLLGITTANLSATSTAVTPATSDDSTKPATTAFVKQVVATGTFPIGTGNNHKLVTQEAGAIVWTGFIDANVVGFADGVDSSKKVKFDLSTIFSATTRTVTWPNADLIVVGASTNQTITNKTIIQQDNLLQLFAAGASTKKAHFDLSPISAGQDRVISVADENMTLYTPALRYITTVTASNVATVDLESAFDDTYDTYVVIAENITVQTSGSLSVRFKIAGTYATTGYLSVEGIAGGLSNSEMLSDFSNAANVKGGFTLYLHNPESTTKYHSVYFAGTSYGGGSTNGSTFGSSRSAVGNSGLGALTGLRFLMSSGNILTGTFRLYGVRKSS